MANKGVYKILFHNRDKVYEIYAREVAQSPMLGFVEISGLIFGERSKVLVDPTEEKLQAEFEGVESSFIPINAVIRIDKVAQEGQNRILPGTGSGPGTVTPFPNSTFTPPKKSD